MELKKIDASPNKLEYLTLLYELGLLEAILPEIKSQEDIMETIKLVANYPAKTPVLIRFLSLINADNKHLTMKGMTDVERRFKPTKKEKYFITALNEA